MKGIQNLRVDYSGHLINMDKMKNNPIEEFKLWFEDAKKNNALIGAQIGTTSYYFLEKQPLIKIKGYQMYGHAISDLINGKLDAVLG